MRSLPLYKAGLSFRKGTNATPVYQNHIYSKQTPYYTIYLHSAITASNISFLSGLGL